MESISDTNLLRIGIAIAAFLLVGIIIFSSRKKPAQGIRKPSETDGQDARLEPSFADDASAQNLENTSGAEGAFNKAEENNAPDPEKIVSILLAARAGQSLEGPDLVVAAEKAGLIYGQRNIFHRMVDKQPDKGPVFSVANLVNPGTFDLRTIKEMKTPGIHFFMTLPGPMSALDAWDTMLPTAQRMAELMDAIVLDDQRNALSRQRVAHIREDLRAFDRQQEKLSIKP